MLSTSSEQCCPRCQAILTPDAAVCPNCGLRLAAPAEEALSGNTLPLVPQPAVESFGAQPPVDSSETSTASQEMSPYTVASEAQTGVPAASASEAFAAPPAGLWPQQAGVFAPPAPAAQPRPRRSRKPILIVLAVLVILGASGGLAYILTRPNPVISVTSAGASVQSGSPDTVLHVSGHDFTKDSTIIFLLDSSAAPGAPKARSDANGNVQADLTITDDWTFGTHSLTAKDAQGYVTRNGLSLKVIPAPLLIVSSAYQVGQAAAVSQAMSLQISGKRFSPNSAVTLLLDGNPLPGVQPITSDSKGRFALTLPSAGLTLGNHSLAAKDSKGYSTKQPEPLVVVAPGQAGTPGPNGAPTDNKSFTLSITIQHQDTLTGQQEDPFNIFLTITGRPDPAGGMPCDTIFDDGQPHTFTGDLGGGLTYTETDTYGCSGSYQGGNLKYVEILIRQQYNLSNGDTCDSGTINLPYRTYEGTFSSATSISGSYVSNGLIISCTGGLSIRTDPEQGTWTATI